MGVLITLVFVAAVLFLAYRRLSLLTFTATFTVLLIAYTLLGASGTPAGAWKGFLWLLLAGLWLLNLRPLRKAIITRPFVKAYLKLLPSMSQTEREALEAGTVWWDGELFTGAPKGSKLLSSGRPHPPRGSKRSRVGRVKPPARRPAVHRRRLPLVYPAKVLGEKADIGIPCPLIPRGTPGIAVGRR